MAKNSNHKQNEIEKQTGKLKIRFLNFETSKESRQIQIALKH
jgi:hypothetical protein